MLYIFTLYFFTQLVYQSFSKLQWVDYTITPNILDVSQEKGIFTLTITVDSDTPVSNFGCAFYAANNKNILGGGHGITSQQTGIQKIIEQFNVNQYLGNGQYYWNGITIQNQAEEKYIHATTLYATVTGSKPSTKPVITQAIIDPATLQAPGSANIIVTVQSDAPPYYLCISRYDPSDNNIEGGCGSENFQPTGIANQWQVQTSRSFTTCQPKGVYSVKDIKIISEALIESDKWAGNVLMTLEIPNCKATGTYCNIVKIIADPNIIDGNATYTISIVADSSSDINWLSYVYTSPTGMNILGGGGSMYCVKQTMTIDGITKEYQIYNFTMEITAWMPRGTYQWTNVIFENEQKAKSAPKTLDVFVGTPNIPNLAFNIDIDVTKQISDWKKEILSYLSNKLVSIDEKEIARQFAKELEIQLENNVKNISVILGSKYQATLDKLNNLKQQFSDCPLIKNVQETGRNVAQTFKEEIKNAANIFKGFLNKIIIQYSIILIILIIVCII